MIPAAPLGDIVQQHGHIEHAPRHHLTQDHSGERMVFPKHALFDACQQADGADAMLIHRIMVVHIELHLRHDATEIRYKASEHCRLIHPAQHRFRVLV